MIRKTETTATPAAGEPASAMPAQGGSYVADAVGDVQPRAAADEPGARPRRHFGEPQPPAAPEATTAAPKE